MYTVELVHLPVLLLNMERRLQASSTRISTAQADNTIEKPIDPTLPNAILADAEEVVREAEGRTLVSHHETLH